MNAVQVARSPGISGPPSSISCQRRGADGRNEIILCENEKIVSNQTEVCNILNNYFVNVAKDIGNDATQYDQDFLNHPSILKNLENAPQKFTDEKFSFKPTTETYVHKVISNLDPKKVNRSGQYFG